jgi:hypothetical protein
MPPQSSMPKRENSSTDFCYSMQRGFTFGIMGVG